MVQNKTQIACNTHRYKKIVKKIQESQIIQAYISKMSQVTYLIKNGVIKKIEHQIHQNTPEELFYHYTTTVST